MQPTLHYEYTSPQIDQLQQLNTVSIEDYTKASESVQSWKNACENLQHSWKNACKDMQNNYHQCYQNEVDKNNKYWEEKNNELVEYIYNEQV